MRRIISVSLLALSLTAGLSQVPALAAPADKPLELAANAPERHVVVPGDTLWGISAKFLKQPYRWPELWRMNEDEVKNPHLIYPGQVLVLERDADGKPRLRTAGTAGSGKLEPKVYVKPQQVSAIASIPYPVIQPYLAKPLVLTEEELARMPRVVAAENSREILGAGDKIYVGGLTERHLNWHAYRQGKVLVNPDNGENLGYEAVHVASARLVAEGNPATLRVTASQLELQLGDRLEKAVDPEVIAYVPQAAPPGVRGRILTVYGATGYGGQFSIISLSAGAREGLKVGHVMRLSTAGREVVDRYRDLSTARADVYVTPEELSGFVFIFRVMDKVSYALVMSADNPIALGDVVHSPN